MSPSIRDFTSDAGRSNVVPTGRAVVVRSGGAVLENDCESVLTAGHVIVRVAALGLCRTDLRVFDGQTTIPRPTIPGHEFSGTVEAMAADVDTFAGGERVVVNPVLPCGRCEYCAAESNLCQDTSFLGVDRDGACADLISVPASSVFSISPELSFEAAVFAEPVAASLAVLNAGLRPEQRGLILGENRISILTRRILESRRFTRLSVCSADQSAALPRNHFDFAIETFATTQTIRHLVACLRPRGTLVLKSRQPVPLEITVSDLLPKELRIIAVNYGSFDESIRLLSTGSVRVDDLIGARYSLDRFAAAFAEAALNEDVKTFICPQQNGSPCDNQEVS